MNSMAFAVILFLHSLASFSQSFAISRWLMGGLDAVEYSTLAWLAVVVVGVSAMVIAWAPQWNLLAVGDDWAASRGVSTVRLTAMGYVAGSVLTGLVTSLTGPDRFRRTDRAACAAAEAGRGSSCAAAVRVPAGRGIPRGMRYAVAYGDRADGNSSRRPHGAVRRAVFHVAAEVAAEELVALVLVGGGARSGKSRWALERARKCGDRLVYRRDGGGAG